MFSGVYRVSIGFPCNMYGKETLYSSKGKIVYAVGKPCNIHRLGGNPIVIIGVSSQSVNITGFPHNTQNLSF